MNNKAFSLIELSLVLVIIGLLIGGVLSGKDLIAAAETRKTVSQLNNYISATNTFRTKYNCLPGDCSKAVSLGLGTDGDAGANGNGNGKIQVFDSDDTDLDEAVNYFYHLMRANLINDKVPGGYGGVGYASGPGVLYPKLLGSYVKESRILISTASDLVINSFYDSVPEHAFGILNYIASGVDSCQACSMLPSQVQRLDGKMDDGLPKSGRVQAAEIGSGDPPQFLPATETPAGGSGCINNSVTPNAYNFPSTITTIDNLCAMVIKLPF